MIKQIGYLTDCTEYEVLMGINKYCVFLDLGNTKTFKELISQQTNYRTNKEYFIYLYNKNNQVLKGIFSNLYNRWGIFTGVHVSELNRLDFVYNYEHKIPDNKNYIGILYSHKQNFNE